MQNEKFGSNIGAILAIVGSAVGLGNLWRFPYMVGQHGGAAFILLYLFFTVVFSLPIFYAELSIGRHTRSNPVTAFEKLKPKTRWNLVGYLGVLTAFIILGFYIVVGGWTIDYLIRSIGNDFAGQSHNALSATFNGFVSSPVRPILGTLGYLLINVFVISLGVQKGIEKASKILIPILFLIVLVLAIKSLTLPGASKGLHYLFVPDFTKINGDVALQALGQALFSLSVGMGCMITYGSYVPQKTNILKDGIFAAGADIGFALIACLAIIPAVFAFNATPEQGPGLAFIIFPELFQHFSGGYFFQILFFVCLFIAALTSSVSLVEVPVAFFLEKFKWTRKKSVSLVFLIVASMSMVASLSMGNWNSIQLFGKNIFESFDFASSSITMPLGGLLIAGFVGWVLPKKVFYDELSNQNTLPIKRLFPIIFFLVKFVLPIGFLLVMISNF